MTSIDEINRLLAEADETTTAAESTTPRKPPAGLRPRVVNLRHEELGDAVYVGRANPRRGLAESAFANPYRVGVDGTREEVVEKYRQRLLGDPALLDRLYELRGRRLACWCSPESCHADVLAELVDADHVLDDLAAAGVAVDAVDGRLRLSPPSSVDAALKARAAACKAGILQLLATRPDAATLWREAVEKIAESTKLPPGVLEAALAARVRWVPASRFKDR